VVTATLAFAAIVSFVPIRFAVADDRSGDNNHDFDRNHDRDRDQSWARVARKAGARTSLSRLCAAVGLLPAASFDRNHPLIPDRHPLENTPSLDDLYQKYDDSENQKNMDESAHRIRRNEPKHPQYKQDHCNRIEHRASPLRI
jgi:hypothetical protein